MRIARFTHDGHTRLGVVDGDDVVDVGSSDATLPTDHLRIEIEIVDEHQRVFHLLATGAAHEALLNLL